MKKQILFIAVFMICSFASYAQCAMCRAVLESGESQATAEGINNGIVYLMAIPYIVIGGIGYMIYRTYNKSTKPKN